MTSNAAASTPPPPSAPRLPKLPRLVLSESVAHTLHAFPPNRDTLGGTAYLLREAANRPANILIDCPAWDETTHTFLQQQGGVQWLFLTHRDGIGKARAVQTAFNCQILIQEQEAYLLPGLDVTSFQQAHTLTPTTRALWTPGHSPGSACLYHSGFGGVLFTGRHLLPTPAGILAPIKTAKTFHWPRQLKHVQTLIDEFSPETLSRICAGANLGFLRGKYAVENAYEQLQQSLT
ncbi:MAG: MBL fold metallo-hydrolase [Leptolyngbyaceae cyanobacterium bins.349]|nr:MBL fold metallo-hydrolase [Leptolyngbyaceae cyanobacterium bins.349]